MCTSAKTALFIFKIIAKIQFSIPETWRKSDVKCTFAGDEFDTWIPKSKLTVIRFSADCEQYFDVRMQQCIFMRYDNASRFLIENANFLFNLYFITL